VVLEVDDGTTAVCFNAPSSSSGAAAAAGDLARLRSLEPLGPDLWVRKRTSIASSNASTTYPPDAPIGDVLLDQGRAGIGNVFKSEIRCRVHPSTPVGACRKPSGGTSTKPRTHSCTANLGGGGVTYQGGLAVYGKVRRPVPLPHADHAWNGDDARVTYWCPSCQPLAVLDPP
jgi:formamidopyrimidine-DNA glycosylase